MVRHWNCCKCEATLARDEVADWRLKPGSRIQFQAICENCVCEENAVNDVSELLLPLRRVCYGKPDTPVADREYRISDLDDCPVGTISD